VFANFDGREKHRTRVGAGVFVGSGTVLVAPATIGEGARTGAGAVVTARSNVPSESRASLSRRRLLIHRIRLHSEPSPRYKPSRFNPVFVSSAPRTSRGALRRLLRMVALAAMAIAVLQPSLLSGSKD
jgi:hypothetical protein